MAALPLLGDRTAAVGATGEGGILDDRSRLCCHAQWYLAETAGNTAHGLVQAFPKRGLPRALMSDNGSAFTAGEIEQGPAELGVLDEPTLPHSAYQNAKQERTRKPIIAGRRLPGGWDARHMEEAPFKT